MSNKKLLATNMVNNLHHPTRINGCINFRFDSIFPIDQRKLLVICDCNHKPSNNILKYEKKDSSSRAY